MKRPCKYQGCGQLADRGGYCNEHKPARELIESRSDAARQRARKYKRTNWKRLRLMHLRTQPMCAICGEIGNEVDHVIPVSRGGTDARENLQTLCKRCHSRKTAAENGINKAALVTVVEGAPGSGKTTFVRENMDRGDVVVDFDAIYAALSFQPWYDRPEEVKHYVFVARDAVMKELAIKKDTRAWVITSQPRYETVERMAANLAADIVSMHATATECKQRLASDPRRNAHAEDWDMIVDSWFATRRNNDAEPART